MKRTFNLFLVAMIFTTMVSLMGMPVAPAYAASTLTVQSAADDGTAVPGNCPGAGCRLRDALAAAAAGDTIDFAGDYTITLTSMLTISQNVMIDGVGHSVTISGNNSMRVFYVNSGVTFNLNHLTVANGYVIYARSGGLYNDGGTVNVTNSTFSSNGAGENNGGAIYNVGTMNVTNSTFSGNSATWYGGAIRNDGTLTVSNSTFSGNNSAYGVGGGIANFGTLTVRNSIVANNTGGNCNGPIGGSNNLANDGSCGGNFTNSSFILLGTLGDYGGDTQTFPLLPGSYAIDRTSTYCPTEDQRGISRGTTCDIGAFESQGFTLGSLIGTPQSAVINTAFATPLALTVTANDPAEPVNGGKVTFTAPVSGASATFASNPVAIASGSASVTATANATVGGPYTVSANANGSTGGVNFSLTNLDTGHTVTFNTNGGSGSMSPQTASSPTALTLNAFTRTGYSFAGWNTAADGSGSSYADGATYDFSADVTLYAQWMSDNTAPVAANDSYNATMSTLLNGPSVLANDSDADSDPLTASLVAGPAHASAFTFNPDGTFAYTPANGYKGIDTFTYTANDAALDSNTATVTITITPLSKTFTSNSKYDGWIRESSETSNRGGKLIRDFALRLGDQARNQQNRALIHFATSSLPDNAVITKVTLKIKKINIQGADPFLWGNNLLVDIKTGFFGSSSAPQSSDFQAAATRYNVGAGNFTASGGRWYTIQLKPADLANVNRTGPTQFRLHFAVDDNNNNFTDVIRFYAGNATQADDRPVMIVEYYVPLP